MEVEVQTKPIGEMGIRYDQKGTAYVGQQPQITRVTLEENSLGMPTKQKDILDMNPTTIGFDQLVNILEQQNRIGRPTVFLGQVVVQATSPDRYLLTELGEAVLNESV